jgi:hypothetical protein
MDCDIAITKPTCFASTNGGVDLYITNNIGKVFTEWQNLPKEAVLTNDGKTVTNLKTGIYNLVVFDDISQQSFKVKVDSPPQLVIDFIKVDPPKCADHEQTIEIGWSGGVVPYSLSIGGSHTAHSLFDNYYKWTIKPNIKYTISITDKNNCKVISQEIYHSIEPLKLSMDIEQPKCSGCKAKKVKLNITGGKPPYKIGWFDRTNLNTPIVTNKLEMNNKLVGGKYNISVIDDNDCYITHNFIINSPNAIRVNSKIKADYSHNQLFPPVKINKVYNLLLLDKNISNVDLGSYVDIISSGGEKISVRLVLDTGKTTINKQEYQYYYVAPGFTSIDPNEKYTIIIDNKKYPLSLKVSDNTPNKLIIGSLVLDNNFGFAFNNNDIIEITYNENKILSSLSNKYILNGYYLGNIVTTTLTFLNNNNSEKLLKILNTPATGNFYVASKTTKKNNNLGNINLIISGGSDSSYNVRCVGDNYDQNFITKGYLIINNLQTGKYKLHITDTLNIAEYHNNLPISDHKNGFDIYIPGSVEEENKILTEMTISKYKIDKLLLNNYNNAPERLPTFTQKENETKLIINIAPTDASFTISGQNYEHASAGYQSINEIPPGVYNIVVSKKGYKKQSTDFSVTKNNLNMVTVILERDNI